MVYMINHKPSVDLLWMHMIWSCGRFPSLVNFVIYGAERSGSAQVPSFLGPGYRGGLFTARLLFRNFPFPSVAVEECGMFCHKRRHDPWVSETLGYSYWWKCPMSFFDLSTIGQRRCEGGLVCCYKGLPPFIEESSLRSGGG